MTTRGHDFDWDEFPVYGGQGSLHDLNSDGPEPRLWFAKSVSKQAALAYDKKPEPVRTIGFHRPPTR